MKFEKNNRINKLVKIPYDRQTTRRPENENKNTKNAFYDFFEWVKNDDLPPLKLLPSIQRFGFNTTLFPGGPPPQY